MSVKNKHVTFTRADRIILACVSLMECEDFNRYDPDGTARRALDQAADKAREIRDMVTTR